ncbi:MAG: hypothetical protein H6937_12995 [Burkholderiales bacterium]|nr:hypothetical protein [Burkholderiales bacterium]
MRADQHTIPVDSTQHDTSNLYDNIETRPDTSEAQKETGRNAYIELLESQARWAGGAILGCNFPKDFKEQGGTTLLNRQIKSAHELAVMAQILHIPHQSCHRFHGKVATDSTRRLPPIPVMVATLSERSDAGVFKFYLFSTKKQSCNLRRSSKLILIMLMPT